MKFIASLVLIMLLSFAACLFFPWWSIAIVALVVAAMIPQTALRSFVSGFSALLFLWGLLSFWISTSNDHILAHKVSLLILKTDSPFLLMLISSLIGGVVAGFAALAGSFLKKRSAKN